MFRETSDMFKIRSFYPLQRRSSFNSRGFTGLNCAHRATRAAQSSSNGYSSLMTTSGSRKGPCCDHSELGTRAEVFQLKFHYRRDLDTRQLWEVDARGTSPLPVSKLHNVRHCVRHEALLVPGNASAHTSITRSHGLEVKLPWR